MSKKSNWNKIRKLKDGEKAKYRNVYENQQLDRGQRGEKQSMLSRVLLTAVLSFIVFWMSYLIISFICYGADAVKTSSENPTPDEQGSVAELYESAGQEVPEEYRSEIEENGQVINQYEELSEPHTINDYLKPNFNNVFFSLLISIGFFGIMYEFMRRNLIAQNLMNETTDINQYQDDQHIQLPEEVQIAYDWFPDAGAHSSVQVSSMISHMALKNKGLNMVAVPKRAKRVIVDENGEVMYYKGDILLNEKEKPIYEEKPMINEDFMEELFTASEALPEYHISYDARKIKYNPDGTDRVKKGGTYDTVADLINNDWFIPDYETQRPAGAYIVDTEPVNTMVLAITRAGKGQTVIEPTLDMWTRELRPNNIVINDPKGELLVKFYVRATIRGFQVIQFNLINNMKTDIYNPIGLAAEAAREGDFTKCAQYVESIANVFFPPDGGEEPVWSQAANNAFKRTAYGLIDFYLEEENELRQYAEKVGMDDVVLNNKLDEMWGHVTLYNCYQMFVQMTSQKKKNPAKQFMDMLKREEEKAKKEGKVDEYTIMHNEEPERFKRLQMAKKIEGEMWNGKPAEDLLTLYFNATDKLPQNGMRTLVSNANNALKSMGVAEKMMASVYGIAVSAMSFFTDPTISTLTSGRPSQNVDLSGISFPRRIGVRFHAEFMKKYHLIGTKCVWEAFADRAFTKNLGKEYFHENLVSREGWAKYYIRGMFPNDITYIRLQIKNAKTDNLLYEFHFSFTKEYQKSLDGRHYVKDPILDKKTVRNGTLTELKAVKKKNSDMIIYKKGKSTFSQKKIENISSLTKEAIEKGEITQKRVETNTITMMSTRYSENPKMIFFVTPPHLKQYAKLLLILLKQLVDLNFEQSYMTEKDQKPLYKTRFMLDELGNLESDGHGIQDFSTMLSIGLGQDQQFTLILQTLQQLRDVYGDSEDKIVQGNTSNIVFLKSTDDSMIDTLVKMSGITHESYIDQKTITRDMEKLVLNNEGKASYTMTTREVPVIKANDLQFLPKSNSIVYRAGDAPIWNRNETILPMSWKLFEKEIGTGGQEYSLKTIPTLSTAMDFDVRKNQPDFTKMLEKRMAQVLKVKKAKKIYQSAYKYDDYDLTQLDPDEYSKDIMEILNDWIREEKTKEAKEETEVSPEKIDYGNSSESDYEENKEVIQEVQAKTKLSEQRKKAIFAGNMLSPADLVSDDGRIVGRCFDKEIATVYEKILKYMWNDRINFYVLDGNLYSADQTKIFVIRNVAENIDEINKAISDPGSRVFSEQEISEEELGASGRYTITDDFYRWLANRPNWNNIANGLFEREMAKQINEE